MKLRPGLSTQCSAGTEATLAAIKLSFQENGHGAQCFAGALCLWGLGDSKDCQRKERKPVELKSAVVKDLQEMKQEAAATAAAP